MIGAGGQEGVTAVEVPALLREVPGVDISTDTAAYAVDGWQPAAVVRPDDVAALSAAVRVAAAHKLAVIPWGAGTAVELGNAPTAYDVALDLTALHRVVEYRPRDLTITVEAGMTIAAVQRVLDEHRQLLALDPWLPEVATVGGTLAANCTGPRRVRYGTARDILIGASAVLADGTAIKAGGRVVKNVAGYDLNKLLIGSHGSLAVITSATFKLLPAPPARGMVAAVFASVEEAHTAAMRIGGSTLGPLTLDVAAPVTARMLMPDLPAGWLLAVEVAGSEAGVERSRRELLTVTRDAGRVSVFDLGAPERERLYTGLRDFGCGTAPGGPVARTDAALLVRAAVLPSQVARVCRLLVAEGEHTGILARVGSGLVYGWWPESGLGELRSRIARLRAALRPLEGVLVVERCLPAVKQELDVWGIEGADVALMRRVKQTFDPAGVLSPGRGPGG